MPRRPKPDAINVEAYVYRVPDRTQPLRLVISRWDDDLSTGQVIEFAPDDMDSFSPEEATEVNTQLFKDGHSPLFVDWEDVLAST